MGAGDYLFAALHLLRLILGNLPSIHQKNRKRRQFSNDDFYSLLDSFEPMLSIRSKRRCECRRHTSIGTTEGWDETEPSL
ncbi:hypothetical protein Y032_0205g1914 [Ancylostoma ceylanicum]|uniref:Uncharacterized protein n=1 Tax=Ancylostoma ceylanicum TaxID=53326 RepID=A0A016SME1_9BILA|nr:hypothetical protein Y032_0205g1914 [Ancylostoma ceylanicum]